MGSLVDESLIISTRDDAAHILHIVKYAVVGMMDITKHEREFVNDRISTLEQCTQRLVPNSHNGVNIIFSGTLADASRNKQFLFEIEIVDEP